MQNSFGNFLKQKRQEKHLTQKQLAKVLIVSESAVSKWEKDVAHPDITLLPKLSEILGVTEHELITASIDDKTREEKTQAKKWRTFSFAWNLFFYIAYALALLPCFICNLVIDKTLSWFWIVLSALVLAFTFTNLPQLIKKHKLILLPICMYVALCMLLGVCCIYSGGKWFFIAALSVLLGLIIIFIPIYIARYKIFINIKKYNSFASMAIDFVVLNILLMVIDAYVSSSTWYFTIALPIVSITYAIINILLCVKFLNINKLLKTSIILFLTNLFMYIPPMFVKLKDTALQKEIIDGVNILKADLGIWKEKTIGNNIHLIMFLTLFVLSVAFLTFGLILHYKKKK